MRIGQSLLVLAMVGLMAGCAEETEGLATGARSGTASTGRATLQRATERLPATVAGFTRRDTTWHEPDRAGMGVAVDYDGPARSAVSTGSARPSACQRR